MKSIVSIVIICLAASWLAACESKPNLAQTSKQNPVQTSSQNQDYPPVPAPARIDVIYQCDQGVGAIEMRFFPNHGVAVLVLEQKTHELQQQISASGTWYSNAIYSFRSKGNQAWLEIGRRAPIECKAQN